MNGSTIGLVLLSSVYPISKGNGPDVINRVNASNTDSFVNAFSISILKPWFLNNMEIGLASAFTSFSTADRNVK